MDLNALRLKNCAVLAAILCTITAVVAGPLKAWAIFPCEVEVAVDGGDSDDPCAVISEKARIDNDIAGDSTNSKGDIYAECRQLKSVLEKAHDDGWCAIDHSGLNGAMIFIQDPLESKEDQNKDPGRTKLDSPVKLDGPSIPIIISGYLLQYSWNSYGDAEYDEWVCAGDNWVLPLLKDDELDPSQSCSFNPGNLDKRVPLITKPEDGERAKIDIEVGEENAAFTLKNGAYLQFRHTELHLMSGAALWVGKDSKVAFKDSSVVFHRDTNDSENSNGNNKNETEYVFHFDDPLQILGLLTGDKPVMGGWDPLDLIISGEPEAIVHVPSKDKVRDAVDLLRKMVRFNGSRIGARNLVTWDGFKGEIDCVIVGKDRCRLPFKAEKFLEIAKEGDSYTIAEKDADASCHVDGYDRGVTEGQFESCIPIDAEDRPDVFTVSGRRIRIVEPVCPFRGNGVTFGESSVTCRTEHGTAETSNGVSWKVACDDGFKMTGGWLSVSCIKECPSNSRPNKTRDQCIPDAGYEADERSESYLKECPGDAVPKAANNEEGRECVCADGKEPVGNDEEGWECLSPCPEHGTRDENDKCVCGEGYKKKGSGNEMRCVEKEDPGDPDGDPAPAPSSGKPDDLSSAANAGDDGGVTAADESCQGLLCRTAGPEFANGDNPVADSSGPSSAGGSCALVQPPGAPLLVWIAFLPAACLSAARALARRRAARRASRP